MELTATNDLGERIVVEDVIDLDRDEDGDLLAHVSIASGATKWERIVDGRVERLK